MHVSNQAVVFTGKNQVALAETPVPVPGEGEVLLRTRKTLISTGTELTVLSGDFPADSQWERYGRFPFHAGYCHAGELAAVGPGVPEDLVGRVAVSHGKHARWVCAKASDIRLVPEGVPAEHAVFYTIAEIVMNGVRRGQVAWGEQVAIYGLGLLGQLAVRFCRLAGARRVYAVDPADARRALLPMDSRIIPMDPRVSSMGDVLQAGAGALDAVFEVTGVAALIPGEFAGLRPQGRFVVLSSPRGATTLDFHDLCNGPSYTIIGAHNGSHPEGGPGAWTKARHNELFLDLLASGDMDVAPLISHRAPWSEAPAMYSMLLRERQSAMGVVLDWEE